jgi:hypothetical protein
MNQMKMKKLCSFILIAFIIVLSSSVASAAKSGILSKPLKKIKSDAVDVGFVKGTNQVLVLSRKAVVLFDKDSGQELARHEFGTLEIPLRLDLADVNSDGQPEALVTSVSSKNLSSYLFSISGGSLSVTAGELPYFFRTINKNGQDLLVGQRSSSVEPFAGAIFELKWRGKKFSKGSKLDLPKRVGIYQFTPADPFLWDKFWVRKSGGQLRLYEKVGKKWKVVYKTSDRYRGDVNCFEIKLDKIMTERIKEPLCIPTPAIVLTDSVKGESRIIVDSHKFLLGGVILDPSVPMKGALELLVFDEDDGLISCKTFGPYQGWIANYFVETTGEGSKNKTELFVLRNGDKKYGAGGRISKIDITNIDCRDEM